MNMTSKWVCLITFVFVFCVSAPVCAGEEALSPGDPQRIQAALRSSARSLGLQSQLPAGNKKIVAEDSFLDKIVLRRSPLLPNIAEILFYGSLATIAIVIFMTWRDNLWSSSRARRLKRSAEESAPSAEPAARMKEAQVEADELARQGNFAEAMHTLLLRSVEELRRHLGVSIAASLTSREILRHLGLPFEGRSLFADIIGRVEVSYFGGYRPGTDEYTACRVSFDALTDVLRRYSAQSGSFS